MKGEEWLDDPRVQEILLELEQRIRALYPTAIFEVSHGGEPDGVYLTATIAHADAFDVLDPIIDRLLEIQIDEGLPVYVIPVRPEPTSQAVAPSDRVTG
jgi:hypothetical protein